ncbi:hypothetical protein AB1Y20_012404 [Prymnesium parvum]|uniref:Protein arginine N-methyltransferase n=1 Tax=Prymnesium parvum TaxID=97485 RepID=A0AB34IJF3_PRYPA
MVLLPPLLASLLAALLEPPRLDRRLALHAACGLAAVPPRPSAASSAPLVASWRSTDGFADSSFIQFDLPAYEAMRDDERRTPLFIEAIRRRISSRPEGSLLVVEVGTGPFALLAIAAARAGAKKVYAIEASAEAAARAREAVRAARLPPSAVEVLEGLSTAVELPEKVDLLVAEIAGSVASEEGAYATIRDARARFLRRPFDPASYIPCACETLCAPASYALHYALGPPQFDWTKLKEPLRLNCRDETAQLLAPPQRVESLVFADEQLPSSGRVRSALSWRVDGARLEANERTYYAELKREGAKEAEAAPLARAVARSFSGIAFWPRLLLDPEGTLVVESRGPQGEHQKSHWQTVLPLLAAKPVPVEPSQTIRVTFEADLRDGKPDTPLMYTLAAEVSSA